MKPLYRFLLVLILIVFCVSCDQVTKVIAYTHLVPHGPQTFLNDTFRLVYVENSGAFLSLGSGWPVFFQLVLLKILPVIFLLILSWFLFRAIQTRSRGIVAFALILSGGIGNVWDRIMNEGRVIDFMNLGLGSLRTGIFNFADVFITIGFVLLVYLSFRPASKNGAGS